MKHEFILRIDTPNENFEEVSKIFEIIPSDTSNYWDYIIKNKGFLESLDEISCIVKEKFQYLEDIEITKNDITIWLYFEYSNQCNMEFSPKFLNILAELNMTFCVSCWER